MRRILLFALILGAISVAADAAERKRPDFPKELIDGDYMYSLLPPGGIPEINDPEFVEARQAVRWMHDEEAVIGLVTPDGEPRAYSTWQLDHHEIVNDHAGKTPIAVTW